LVVPFQFPTIQAAINVAPPGSTILVSPGVYRENIDLRGLDIVLRSSLGAALTTIDGQGLGPVIRIGPGQDRRTVIRGFTIANGSGLEVDRDSLGGGIYCESASPTVRDNIFFENYANQGGGLFCRDGSPLVESNLFHGNSGGVGVRFGVILRGGGVCVLNGNPTIRCNRFEQNSTGRATYSTGRGGALYCDDNAVIESNVFASNSAVGDKYAGGIGGGIFCGNGVIIANNVFFKNSAYGGVTNDGRAGAICCRTSCVITNNSMHDNTAGWNQGSAIVAEGGTTISNSIVRASNASSLYPVIQGSPAITYSNVSGGWPGNGNIDADPKFVDAVNGDFHLRYDSPCRDKGNPEAPGHGEVDFEGDPRIAGGTIDMGADEFHPHLYVMGELRPGGVADVKIIGIPATAAVLAYSSNPTLRNPPIHIPGTGDYFLQDPVSLLPIGGIPTPGFLHLPVAIDRNLPTPFAIAIQALVGSTLTNASVPVIR